MRKRFFRRHIFVRLRVFDYFCIISNALGGSRKGKEIYLWKAFIDALFLTHRNLTKFQSAGEHRSDRCPYECITRLAMPVCLWAQGVVGAYIHIIVGSFVARSD